MKIYIAGHMGLVGSAKADFIYDNMAIALNVIHSAYKFGVKKLLNLGSSCIYPRPALQPMKEEYLLTGRRQEEDMGRFGSSVILLLM